MFSTIIEFGLLGWVIICAVRAAMSREHKISVAANVAIRVPLQFAYKTYLKVSEYYLELSRAHRKYELPVDGDRDVIHVWEKAGFQMVKHQYRIIDVKQDAFMKLVSEDSEVTIFGIIKSHSRSEVSFEFDEIEGENSRVSLNINIVFPGVIRHFLAMLVLTDVIWQLHANDEMRGLVKVIEERFVRKDDVQFVAA